MTVGWGSVAYCDWLWLRVKVQWCIVTDCDCGLRFSGVLWLIVTAGWGSVAYCDWLWLRAEVQHIYIYIYEYCFTSLSAQSWQYRDRRKPEAGTTPYSYFEWLQGFFIVHSTIGSTVHSMPLNSLEHCLCTTTMTNIRPDRDSIRCEWAIGAGLRFRGGLMYSGVLWLIVTAGWFFLFCNSTVTFSGVL